MLFTEKDFRKFKDIKISKNQDKLIKSNGFKGIGAFIEGIKNIVENTNLLNNNHFNHNEISSNNLDNKNILVTGAAGFIGTNLTIELSKNLDEIIIKSDNPEYRVRTIGGKSIMDLILIGKIVATIKQVG